MVLLHSDVQAVALVFDHVLVEMDQNGNATLAEPAAPTAMDPGKAKASDTPRASTSPRGHGTTNAALKLLDDLCMMATGGLCQRLLCMTHAACIPQQYPSSSTIRTTIQIMRQSTLPQIQGQP